LRNLSSVSLASEAPTVATDTKPCCYSTDSSPMLSHQRVSVQDSAWLSPPSVKVSGSFSINHLGPCMSSLWARPRWTGSLLPMQVETAFFEAPNFYTRSSYSLSPCSAQASQSTLARNYSSYSYSPAASQTPGSGCSARTDSPYRICCQVETR
jgi:hypothetical protein